jgi:hypothetical protein
VTDEAAEMWIVIPKWEEFQHRDAARSKVPPWVKTWTRLLSDDDFLDLSHHLRGVLLGIWLEYARSTRQLRGSTVALTRRLGQRVTARDLESLSDAGFIAFSASKPASDPAGTSASPDGDRDRDPPTPTTSSRTTPSPRARGTNPRRRGTNPRTADAATFACGVGGCPGVFASETALGDHRELAHPNGVSPSEWLT